MSYPGGKGGCYQQLINRMPRHRIYVESHFGGGTIFRRKRRAEHSIGIDLDERVFAGMEAVVGFKAICGDACSVLPQLGLSAEDFVYCDPPYPRETRQGRRLYRHEADEAHHRELLTVILALPCRVMISSYANGLYEETLKGWRKEDYSVASRAGGRIEQVWMNYGPGVELHDARYVGATFRERERIRRKRTRWAGHFARLPRAEQQAIYDELSACLHGGPMR